MIAHGILATAMPRLLAASVGTAILAAIAIRMLFRRRQGYLEFRPPKPPTDPGAG